MSPTAHRTLARLAQLDPETLAVRLDATGLAHLAEALQVPRTGNKATVAHRIIGRAHLDG